MGFIEFSIQACLYPSNVLYPELFNYSSINAIIENDNNAVIYQSKKYKEISQKSQQYVEKNGTTLIGDELVHFEKLKNGKIFWSDDVRNISRLTESLNDIREQISDDNELLKAENKLKAKEATLKEKTQLYNLIDKNLQPYFLKINSLLNNLKADDNDYEYKMGLSCLYLAYIKRKSNLLILSRQNEKIDSRELYLSVNELFNELSSIGVICNVSYDNCCEIESESLIMVFQIVEETIENCLCKLDSTMLNIVCSDNEVIVRLQLSGDDINIETGDVDDLASKYGLVLDSYKEDEVFYLSINYREERICH